MKNDLAGIFWQMDMLDPAAARAQQMAELEQLAKYRSQLIQQYKDWSDPVKRAEIKLHHAKEEAAARKILPTIPAEQVAVRTGQSKLSTEPYVSLSFGLPKLTWWQRFKRWIGSLISLT